MDGARGKGEPSRTLFSFQQGQGSLQKLAWLKSSASSTTTVSQAMRGSRVAWGVTTEREISVPCDSLANPQREDVMA